MSLVQYALGIGASVLTFGIVIEMLRRRRLRERHAIWWLVAGLFAILISVFPGLLSAAASTLGFAVPVNLVFFVSFFVLFLVALQHSSELTQFENHNRALLERIILLELKFSQLEKTTARGETETEDEG